MASTDHGNGSNGGNGTVLASGSVGKIAAIDKALALADELAAALRDAEGEIEGACPPREAGCKVPWVGVVEANVKLAGHVLSRLNESGIDIWEAKALGQEGRAALELLEREVSRYEP